MSTEQTEETTAPEETAGTDGKQATEKKKSRASTPAPKVEHFTPDERAARGKAARAEVPRSSHADWEPPPHRPDPVELLEEQAQTRVPELVPIRYGRMLVSPFTFYRGAAYLMASDLAGGPRTGLHTQLCGDAHLSNFGVFAAPDRRLVFAINDFDETLPGPFEWDVKRLVASFAVAGRDRGFDEKTRAGINRAVGRHYREAIREFAEMRNLDLWYSRIDVERLVARVLGPRHGRADGKRLEKNLEKTRTKDSLKAFGEADRGRRRRAADHQRPAADRPARGARRRSRPRSSPKSFQDLIRQYRRTLSGDRRRLLERFRFVDAARKVVGVGSVGTRAWVVLMLGRDGDDPLFLQAKEAQPSVLEPFLGKSEFANHGQRVVEGQRLMQAASDIMLGWLRTDGHRRRRARLLPPPALGREGLGGGRRDGAERDGGLRRALRLDAGEGARPLRRRGRDRAATSARATSSTRRWPVRRGLRRPERARLRRAQAGGRLGSRGAGTGL